MTTERRHFILQIAMSPFNDGVGWAAHVIGHDNNDCHIRMVDLLTKMKLPGKFGAVHDMAVSDANMKVGSCGREGNLSWALWLGDYTSSVERAGFLVTVSREMIP
ncbi:hypothetical protein PQD73_gp074 [Stenotrophomonas phage Salva]|uniref:Uncharacterized protein n=1 Tax=Stenotrophomonas phage Salva TaxID=2801524 RepID=A0A7U3WEL7_9CAUD|nr:hypothetical protein PQD73_gp074 [Stenotrophomonas phage Salva]QQM18265.1 hypothetical protein CPT_Salva_102 [Stenotrophomonas phage Salva]